MPKIGEIVECRFLDHCEDGEVLEFAVYGKITGVTKSALRITSWSYGDGILRSDRNEKSWSIVRKAITGLTVLSPE